MCNKGMSVHLQVKYCMLICFDLCLLSVSPPFCRPTHRYYYVYYYVTLTNSSLNFTN